MASLSLRAYLQKIENLIDRGQNEEAVAHCKHILKKFPKHVDTYRLLGKSYLEMQRFQEASDVLQRVLSVFPDDFVSHIGLSIIREDSDNLDEAIWHMERAFEIQPSNNAVQEELKRLYGRRDGVVPPKILLTRGALVRMYVRGEAYPQAIAEGIAALNEDAQRTDIEILLAKSYLRTNQSNEAFQLCQKILKTLPYSFEANQLCAEIHILNKQSDQADPYLEKVRMLDPYAAFVNETTPTSNKVDENAIIIDEMDFSEMAMNGMIQKTEESSLFVDESYENDDLGLAAIPNASELDSEAESDFAWLNEAASKQEPALDEDSFLSSLASAAQEEPIFNDEENIVSEPEEPIEPLQVKKAAEPEPISIPEFLQSISPTIPESAAEKKDQISDNEPEPEEQLPDFLSEQAADESPTDSPIDDLRAAMPVEEMPEEQPREEIHTDDLPDWLKALDQDTSQSDIELDLQNEIDSLFTDDGSFEQPIEKDKAGITETSDDQNEDDFTSRFLSDLENEADQPGKTRMFSYTAELPSEEETPVESIMDSENAPEEPAEVPEWLQELDEQSGDLKLDDEQDAVQEPKTTDTGSMPDLKEFKYSDGNYDDVLPDLDTTGGKTIEDDDAFAWLESLAAKQGADADSLMHDETERRETPPEWVLQESGQTVEDSLDEVFSIPSLGDDKVIENTDEIPVTISELEKEFPKTALFDTPLEEEKQDESAWVDEFDTKTSKATQMLSFQSDIEEPVDNSIPEVEGDSFIEPPSTPDEIPDWLKELEEQTSIYALSPKDQSAETKNESIEDIDEDIEFPWATSEEAAEIMPESEAMSFESELEPEGEVSPEILNENELSTVEIKSDFEIYEPQGADTSDEQVDEEEIEQLTPERFEEQEVEFFTDTDIFPPTSIPVEEEPEPVEMEIEKESTQEESAVPITFDIPSDLVEGLLQETEPASPDERSSQSIITEPSDALQAARDLLNKEAYDQALLQYDSLIESESYLEEIIDDLNKALYDNPLNPAIYIRLGDAYNRDNQIQKALDMYQEAENLLQK